MRTPLRLFVLAALLFGLAQPASAQSRYDSQELVNSGHRFFGTVSRGLAQVIETAVSKWGQPNGYILGEEAGGAFIAGLRYGEGMMHLKRGSVTHTYWQGPSIGFDTGGNASKVFTLVYHMRDPNQIFRRYPGVEGSAYFVGGVGANYQQNGRVILAPIRAGVGFRLGANIGYLNYTRRRHISPF